MTLLGACLADVELSRLAVKITRDITEKRQAQEALERAQQELFQAQKMEAVGQLTEASKDGAPSKSSPVFSSWRQSNWFL